MGNHRHPRAADSDTGLPKRVLSLYRAAMKIARSRKGLSVLRSHDLRNGDPWMRGGCFVLAEALSSLFGPPAEVVGIGNGRVAFHAAVRYGDLLLDASGVFPSTEVSRFYPEDEVMEYIPETFWNHVEAVESLSKLFNEIRGRAP